MALVKCKECGEQVSSKAKTCPNCGVKAPKKTSVVTWLVLIVVIFWAFGSLMSPNTASNYSKPSSSSSSTSNTTTRTPPSEPAWVHGASKDEMTGSQMAFARSPAVDSTRRMEFPYSGTTAKLYVVCNKKSEWTYVKFSTAPNLNDTETKSGYNVVATRIRWDDDVESATLTQDWGEDTLHFKFPEWAVSKMLESKSALLELDWHGQGSVYFDLPLHGSTAAITSIRESCSR